MDPISHHLSVLAGVDEKTAAAFLKKYGSINLNLITTALNKGVLI